VRLSAVRPKSLVFGLKLGRGAPICAGQIDRYEVELDRGGQELIEDLQALTRANMEEEADRFAAALASDSILPEDF
jgi:hypothetical protein